MNLSCWKPVEPPPAIENAIEHFGEVRLCAASGELSVGGRLIYLTPTEFRMLYCLLRNRGRTVSAGQLAEYAKTYPELVKVHLSRVRGKTGITIKAVSGFGYRCGDSAFAAGAGQ